MVDATDKKMMMEIWKRCAKSPEYFIKTFVNIQNPNAGGTIPFSLYDFQKRLLYRFDKNRFIAILKSRQLGITTLVAAYSLWLMLFHDDQNILFISLKQDVSKDVITKIKFALKRLPSFLKLQTEENNRLSLRFTNGSQIQAVSSASDSGRSKAVSLLVLDEAAFIESAEELWTSAYSTLSTGGKAIVLSTPNGIGNWFADLWYKAMNGENGFFPITLKWDLHPQHDIFWRLEQNKQLGTKAASQECDCDFLSSGDSVIDLKILDDYEKNYCCEPQIKEQGNDFWIWEQPETNKRYCLFVDCSSGTSSDYTTAHIFDIDNCVQVAEYRGKIETQKFGKWLEEIAKKYNNALIVGEYEAYYNAVVQTLKDLKYPYIYHQQNDLRIVEDKIDDKGAPKIIPGVKVNSNTRPRLIETLIRYFSERAAVIRSVRTINELKTFIWLNNKPQAARGYHDDLTMALATGLWVRDQAIIRHRPQTYSQPAYIQVVQSADTSSVPPQYNRAAVSQWNMPVGQRDQESLTWLLR